MHVLHLRVRLSEMPIFQHCLAESLNGKENMALNIEKIQQLFAQLERMGSNAISRAFQVPLLLFRLDQNSWHEMTVVEFGTLDVRLYFWKGIISEYVAE